VPATSFLVRLARDDDRLPLAELFAAVAEERDGIATEPPVDLDARAASWELDWIFVATAEHEVIGLVHLSPSRHGYCDIALAVARDWRGQGVGTALFETAIAFAREHGFHKLSLSVFAHNSAAIGLYRKIGFVEEGRRVKHFRRQSGELWDSVEMGLQL
jgi:ribosomal protein S18 acetylase RimI-like enzyme